MKRVVVYDSNILYPALLRDLLIRLAESDLIEARWTDKILDEMVRAITLNRPELVDRIKRTRSVIKQNLPDSLVSGYEYLIPKLQLPDSNDRHVLAAAIHCGASIIVTDNLKDFPDSVLSRYKIVANSPDRFLSDLLRSDPTKVIHVIGNLSANLLKPPIEFLELLDSFSKNHMPKAVEIIWEFFKLMDS